MVFHLSFRCRGFEKDSRFLLEPNIKEGKGGLRDLQTLFWEARYTLGVSRVADLASATFLVGQETGGGLITEAEEKVFVRAMDFLWSVRFHLHYADLADASSLALRRPAADRDHQPQGLPLLPASRGAELPRGRREADLAQ